jgi:RNA polymerase sigma-70 factor (ECF subfamily)
MQDFYQKYYYSVRGFIARKIDDEGLIDELTNDVLLAAHNSMPNFNHQCSEFSFICSIAKHRVIDYYRKKKLKTVLFSANPEFEEIADKAIGPERDALKNELKAEIKSTFHELSEGYRKILRLKYVSGLRVVRIAQLLKISVKAVESRLIRAKKEFRNKWNYDKKTAYQYSENKRINRD